MVCEGGWSGDAEAMPGTPPEMSDKVAFGAAIAAGAQGAISRQPLGAHGNSHEAGGVCGTSPADSSELPPPLWSICMPLMSIPGISAMAESLPGATQTNPLVTRKAATSEKVEARAARR